MTVATQAASGKRGGGSFYVIMSVVIAITVVAGFLLNMKIRRLDFGALPLLVHVHAAVFAGWLVFFLVQTTLVRTGAIAVHKRLGWAGACLATAMVLLGAVTTVMAVRRGAVPFFWTPGVFLALNILELAAFAGLVGAAVVLRRRAGWHKRLLLCATIMIAAAGVGRLLPLPLMGGWSPIAMLLGLLVFVAIGMLVDATRGRGVHPAYLWGAGAIGAAQILTAPVAASAPVLWLTALIASR